MVTYLRRDVFQAIADPTRRQLIHLLSQQELNLNTVAERFSISRPAISKHIRILKECGLVSIRQEGRERICRAKPEKLQEVSEWVTQYKAFWEQSFNKLDNYLNTLQEPKTTHEK